MAGIKKQLAKGNLIKSLAISGTITAVITGAGLGISIPIYKRIKNQLSEVSSQVADLSKFMNDLTAKLGIPAGQTFEKELAGGYTLLYSNGKTMIFAGSGDQKSLVMNMNQDGTVGSAAQLEGPAAQQMLGIISEAKSTIGSEADAMEDIMQDFVDQTRDSSFANETVLTGASKEQLIARNALSVNRKLTTAEKDKLLADAAKASGANLTDIKAAEQAAKQLIEERNTRIEEEEKARKAGKNGLANLRKIRAIALKQEAIDYLNNNKHPTTNVLLNGTKYPNILAHGNEEALNLYYQEMKIKDSQSAIADAKRKVATDWLDKQSISYKNVTFKDIIGEGPNATDKTYSDLADGNHDETLQNFYAYHVTNLTKEKSEDQQIQKATTSGKGSSILQKVASSVTSWPSMYVKAKYGYTRPNGETVSASSQLLNGLKNVLMQQGVSEQNYINMINVFDQLLEVSGGKPTKTFKLSTILNTYNESEASQARLLVLKVEKTDLDGSSNLETKYLVARSSSRNIVDLEKLSLSDNNSKTIYYLAQSANMNFSEPITRQSISALISLVENNKALTIVKDKGNEFNELIKTSLALDAMNNNAKKAYISKILLGLLEKYLFEGKDINNFNSDKLIEVAIAVMKTDNAINNSVSSLVAQNPVDLYSLNNKPWMEKLYEFVTTETFNYDDFNTFTRNISFFDNLDKDLKDSINQNPGYLSTAFDIIFNKTPQGSSRTPETKLKIDLEAFAQMSKVAKGSGFDITKPDNVTKIKAATQVSSALQTNKMSAQNAKKISNLIIDIVVADVLDKSQFAEIVKYTDTIFAFGFSEKKVFNILEKVLRPGFVQGQAYGIAEIKANKTALEKVVDEQITKLNQWVSDAKTKLNKSTITQDELEAYIWTLEKKSQVYTNNTGESKGSIVSASIINGTTYFVDHGKSTNGKRRIWISDNTGGKTNLEIAATFDAADSGGDHISSQFAGKNGHLYWTQLVPQSNGGQILFEWDPLNPTQLKKWKIKGDLLGNIDQSIYTYLRIRSLFILDDNVFFGITGAPKGELSWSKTTLSQLSDPTVDEIELETNIKPPSIDSKWLASWTAVGFSKQINNQLTKFFISPLKDNNNTPQQEHDDKTNIVVWTQNGTVTKLINFESQKTFASSIVAIVLGDYDEDTKQQTFFVVDKKGALVKYVVQIANDNGVLELKAIGNPLVLITILDNATFGPTRGATYINGAITLYSEKKVTYIKDQTANLNDIFKHLLNE